MQHRKVNASHDMRLRTVDVDLLLSRKPRMTGFVALSDWNSVGVGLPGNLQHSFKFFRE